MSQPIPHLGYHYYPDDQHFTQSDLSIWIPILRSLGARWLTLRASTRRAIPEEFIRVLQNAHIEPIIHIPCKIGEIHPHELSPLLEAYARWGVRYVVVFDRPNMQDQWTGNAWARKELVERFVDACQPVLLAQHQAGLAPVLPPLEPGGDYWDLAFLEGTLRSLSRRENSSLLHNLVLSAYAWTYGHPLEWGSGGPERWSESKPYSTPQGSQDHRGFRIFEWYHAVASHAGDFSPQVLVIAGGATLSQKDNKVDEKHHQEQNLAIAELLKGGELPSYLLNFSFYHLTSDPSHPDHGSAWFPETDDPRPIVESIQQWVKETAKTKTGIEKHLRRYLLLPNDLDPLAIRDWQMISELIRKQHPTMGFSPIEARLASEVIIAGNEDAIPLAVDRQLKSSGCVVRRLEVDNDFRRINALPKDFLSQSLYSGASDG
jgi:hypothetical protein